MVWIICGTNGRPRGIRPHDQGVMSLLLYPLSSRPGIAQEPHTMVTQRHASQRGVSLERLYQAVRHPT